MSVTPNLLMKPELPMSLQAMRSRPNPLDVVEHLEQMAEKTAEIRPNIALLHKELLTPLNPEDPKGGATEAQRALVRAMIRQYFYTTAASPKEFEADMLAFDQRVWPVLDELMVKNQLTAKWFLCGAAQSRFCCTFVVDIVQQPALALLAAQGVGHTVRDTLAVIPPYDAAYSYCIDEAAFREVRFRAKEMQKLFGGAQKILSLGAGLDAAYWTRGFTLRRDVQEAVLCDIADVWQYWPQLLGDRPELFGMTALRGNLVDVIQDPAHRGVYDGISLSGIASYFADTVEHLVKLIAGAGQLLAPGGRLVFDLQVMHEGYVYDVVGLNWAQTLTLENSATDAIHKVQEVLKICEQSGCPLKALGTATDSAEAPAGVVFWLEKP